MPVKVFHHYDAEGLESDINKWLESNEVEVLDHRLSTCSVPAPARFESHPQVHYTVVLRYCDCDWPPTKRERERPTPVPNPPPPE